MIGCLHFMLGTLKFESATSFMIGYLFFMVGTLQFEFATSFTEVISCIRVGCVHAKVPVPFLGHLGSFEGAEELP